MVDVDMGSLVQLSAWAYVVVLGLVAADAVVPLLPSESVVIVGGVLAAEGHLSPWLVLLVAAAGALTGDLLSYTIGRRANRSGRAVADHRGRVGRVLRWASAALEDRGASVIAVARFVPGGRTATTAVAGYIRFPVARFAGAAAAGALLWAAYGTAIGYLGGRAFEDNTLLAVGAGLAVALAVTLLVEGVRRLRHRSPADAPGPVAAGPVATALASGPPTPADPPPPGADRGLAAASPCDGGAP
jgi:membrane protein DedA with SNARE-associated domain